MTTESVHPSSSARRTKESLAARIIIPLDYPAPAEAEILLSSLEGIPCYLKVGMQLYYAAGPAFVESLKKRGYRVFLDLKLHDIPNTVKGGAESITRLGVDMFNVHAAGGLRMMEAAMEGVDKAAAGAPASATAASAPTAASAVSVHSAASCDFPLHNPNRPLVIAVTQLTSTDRPMLNEQIGIPGSVEESVVRYALLARQAKLDGVVASAREVRLIKEATDESFLTVTPGIRPSGSVAEDQSRTMTPGEALAAGSDYLVIGRPITAQKDPRLAFETLLEEMLTHGHA